MWLEKERWESKMKLRLWAETAGWSQWPSVRRRGGNGFYLTEAKTQQWKFCLGTIKTQIIGIKVVLERSTSPFDDFNLVFPGKKHHKICKSFSLASFILFYSVTAKVTFSAVSYIFFSTPWSTASNSVIFTPCANSCWFYADYMLHVASQELAICFGGRRVFFWWLLSIQSADIL